MVKIEIDGRKISARDGTMLIEAADEAGIYIPRFCYHKKLSVAANCRMCLVEVEKARKPLPACATPVTDGMKIFTKSAAALAAQKGVMEFLLINHPLDCPICDQGGECELQDIAMGYGGDVSRFSERKRVVQDKDLGPLISTEMTRCIHCTRCVRFGEEVAGIKELGATGRGEHMRIGTYVEATIDSELSGNVIDLCPVGALTSKPFRFSVRAWEIQQRDSIAPHDCVGSNISAHIKGRSIKRVVPAENEGINETWIADRDRFSYEGIASADRVLSPMVKEDGTWKKVDWETALRKTVDGLNNIIRKHNNTQVGLLASPSATLEELYLGQKLARGIGVTNIDHRLHWADCSDQESFPVFPWLGKKIAEIENVDVALLVGSNLRKEQPLLSHRLRKAALNGAKVSVVNSLDYDFRFPLVGKLIVAPSEIANTLAGVLKALLQNNTSGSTFSGLDSLVANVDVNDAHKAIASNLIGSKHGIVLLGAQTFGYENAATVRAIANAIATLSQCKLGYLPYGANSIGGFIAGALPNRGVAGTKIEKVGLSASDMISAKLKAYVLHGVEPEYDGIAGEAALEAMNDAEFVVALSSFKSDAMLEYANVILPIGTFAETAGTFVNIEGTWQSFQGVVPPAGEARPAWKVFRVLGNLLDVDGFDFFSIDEVHDEIKASAAGLTPSNEMTWHAPQSLLSKVAGIQRVTERPIYSVDGLVRRAASLQQTADAKVAALFVNPKVGRQLGLENGELAEVAQNGAVVRLPVRFDLRVPDACVFIPEAMAETIALGISSAALEVKKAADVTGMEKGVASATHV